MIPMIPQISSNIRPNDPPFVGYWDFADWKHGTYFGATVPGIVTDVHIGFEMVETSLADRSPSAPYTQCDTERALDMLLDWTTVAGRHEGFSTVYHEAKQKQLAELLWRSFGTAFDETHGEGQFVAWTGWEHPVYLKPYMDSLWLPAVTTCRYRDNVFSQDQGHFLGSSNITQAVGALRDAILESPLSHCLSTIRVRAGELIIAEYERQASALAQISGSNTWISSSEWNRRLPHGW